jgi:hypothetical protein
MKLTPYVIALLLALLLSAEANAQARVDLSWLDNSTDENGFGMERNLNGGAFTVIATAIGAQVVSYADLTVVAPTLIGAPDNVYCYRVFAFNAAGNSPYSNTACKSFAAPKPTIPSAPSGLKTAAAPTAAEVKLSWQNNAPDAEGQRVHREVTQGAGSSDIITIAAAANSYIDRGVRKNTGYRYFIGAFNQGGENYSNSIVLRTPNR